jgi:hypothetical protein
MTKHKYAAELVQDVTVMAERYSNLCNAVYNDKLEWANKQGMSEYQAELYALAYVEDAERGRPGE